MKNLKYLFLTLLGALAFVACTEDEREADWSGIKGKGVYFGVDAQTSYLLEENQSMLRVPVQRTFTEGDLQVLMQLEDVTGIFAADTKARFADGEAEGYVEVVFDFKALQAGTTYQLKLYILDEDHKSGYGMDNLTFTVKYDPWTYVGQGYYRDGIVSEVFNVATPYAQIECEVYKSDVEKDLYRLANVYNNPFYAGPMFGTDPASVGPQMVKEGYITFSLANPSKIYIATSEVGLNVNSDYGWFEIGSICPENGFEDAAYGTMKNNIISFPAGGLFLYLPLYQGGYYFQTNIDAMTRIVMPGGVPTDPSVKIDYEGVMIDPNSNAAAIFNITMNEDAAKVLFAAAELGTDYAPIIAGMTDGSIPCEEITANGEFAYQLNDPGEFMGIFIPVSADGTIFGTAMGVPFEYSTGGVTPSQFAAEFEVEADETFAYFNITPNTEKFEYYWDFMTKADYDAAMAEFGTIEAYNLAFFNYVAEANGVSVAAVMNAYASKGLVEEMLVEGLKPATTYVAYAFCVNMTTGEARSAATIYEFSTLEAQPLDADYEALLGTWTVTSTSSEEGKTPMSFDLTFSQKKSNVMYDVTGWTGVPYPIVAYFQAADAESDALFYIPEQATNTTMNSAYGTIRVCFFGRYYEPEYEQNIFMGQSGSPCLVGGLSSASAGNIQPWSVTIEGTKYNYIGADLFGLILDGDYAGQGVTFADDLTVGPYTMEKAASTQSFEPKAQFSTGMSVIREANLREVDGKLLRREFLAKHNCVMAR